ncbi:hypothetical protein DET49_101117 [Salegentibacter sp. 24]|uniref:DUF2975 domain-containing protein n=1 Tax=Salegentibacter sp. 24 TaxID=2183986 RepID=UPI0010F17C47|nr:DUF2975 domain-containing protein [Salegentibacter sp. 24]TDN95519.1 hypothetical protein DET49_101117 [Salegentibacter sp. 24]
MKPPLFLKRVLDICLILILFTLLISILVPVFNAVSQEDLIPLSIDGVKIEIYTVPVVIVIFLSILKSCLFIFIIYVLRKLIKSFFKDRVFTPFQIKALNLTGQLIIIVTIVAPILNFISSLILKNKARMSLDMELSVNSFWFTFALGLFFILLSKVFEQAKNIKEENELTV